jgi:hypothetical protein
MDIEDASCTATVVVQVPFERAWKIYTEDGVTYSGHDITAAVGTGMTVRFETDELPWRRIQELDHPLVPGIFRLEAALEPVGDGATRVSLSQSGFNEEALAAGILESGVWSLREALADFALYAEHGVALPRHASYRSTVGIDIMECGAGARVVGVKPGMFGEALGLAPGDVLTHLDGAAVYGIRELFVVQRRREPGEEVEATWVRDGRVHTATASLSSFWETVGATPE